jgi:hypothetical protein
METAVRQNDLQLLRQWLLRELRSKLSAPIPLDIRCALKQDNLLVLAQHPATVTPDVEQLFAVLEESIRRLRPEVIERITGQTEMVPVRLYLRLVGQPQPYTQRFFTLVLPAVAQIPDHPPAPDSASATVVRPTDVSPSIAAEDSPQVIAPGVNDAIAASEQTEEEAIAPPLLQPPPTEPVPEPGSIQHRSKPYAPKDGLVSRLGSIPFLERIPLPLLVFCSLVGVITFAGGLFILTRPCVVGGCKPLEDAQRLSQQSAQLARPTATADNVVEAYNHLTEANYLLSTIPTWSPHYDVAQALLQAYGVRAEVYGKVVAALQQANKAAHKSQNPPHPLVTWREIQQLWQGAIALLETVPSDSPIYLLAQQKQSEYEANLAGINQRIRSEQQSQGQISSARSAAEVAEVRETNAKSVDGWRSAYATWQVVVNTLKAVPPGTMAYAEAEQLLAIYQPKLTASQNRYNQEKASAEAYSQALSLAEQARVSERRRQWSQAVAQWQNALTNAQQVSNGTSYHDQIQALISTYQTALTTAQTNLRTAVVAQGAEVALNRACSGSSTICTYSMGATAIQVRLTTDYDWAVRSVIANNPLPGDANTQQALKDYINTLLQSFATASQTAQMPVDLYDAQGQVFGTYDPQLGGFVQR